MGVQFTVIMDIDRLVYSFSLLVLHSIDHFTADTVSAFLSVALKFHALAAVIDRDVTESVLHIRVMFYTMPIYQSIYHSGRRIDHVVKADAE